MSQSGTAESSGNGTYIVAGPDVLQVSDFYVKAGVLHPVAVGSIAVVLLFSYLRMGSNRSITPITTFDWLINVALGSTLAGIINGNSLVRGLLGLATMISFQYIISLLTSHFNQKLAWIFQGPPLVVVFRGSLLTKVMKEHRISKTDVHAALRHHGILNVSLVECAIIEPNGAISVFTMEALENAEVDPEVLTDIAAYRALCGGDLECGGRERGKNRAAGDPGDVGDDGKQTEPSHDSGSEARIDV